MREINLLAGYPEPSSPRYVGADIRTIRTGLLPHAEAKNSLMALETMDMADIIMMEDGSLS